jgi:hypothetical protein
LLAGDKDTWLIAAMLSRRESQETNRPSQNVEWQSPVSANPPGFLVLADDGAENDFTGDVCKMVGGHLVVPVQPHEPLRDHVGQGGTGSSCISRERISGEQLPEDSTVQTLSWHCHFDDQNLAPLYINSRYAMGNMFVSPLPDSLYVR